MSSRVILSSRNKLDGQTDTNFSNVMHQALPYQKIKLNKCIIPLPNTFDSEVFYSEDNPTTTQTATLLDGRYTGSELATVLEGNLTSTGITGASVTYNATTGKLEFTGTDDFVLVTSLMSERLRYQLGGLPSSDVGPTTSYTTGVIDLSGSNWVFVETNFLDTNTYYQERRMNGFSVLLKDQSGNINYFEPQYPIVLHSTEHGQHNMFPTQPTIRILDNFGNVLNTEGLDTMFEFTLC